MLRFANTAKDLAYILCLAAALFSTPLFGNSIKVGTGNSMLPAIQNGAPTLIHYCSVEEVEIGDIVSYWCAPLNTLVAHRVVEKEEDFLIVRGDANPVNDPVPVNNDILVGKVIWVGHCFGAIFRLYLALGLEGRSLFMWGIVTSMILLWLFLWLALSFLLICLSSLFQTSYSLVKFGQGHVVSCVHQRKE